MADEQQTGTENTETQEEKIQEKVETNEPTIKQSELDNIINKRLAKEKAKFEKKYAGIDPEEARSLLEEKEAKELEMQKQRGEFDKVLKETVSKKEQEISQYKAELQKVRIDDALIKTASEYKAIKPEQVANLLKNKVQLGADGTPEIIGENGTAMYNDKGDLLSINEYVGKFIDENPHFKNASPTGAGSVGNVGGNTPKPINLAELNMNNPEDKARYAEYRKEKFKNY